MKRGVFLSYRGEHEREALQVADALAASGISYFLAPRVFRGGEEFRREIIDELHNCEEVFFLLDESGEMSEWTRLEVYGCQALRKTAVPILLGKDIPPMPVTLSHLHCVHLDEIDIAVAGYLSRRKRRRLTEELHPRRVALLGGHTAETSVDLKKGKALADFYRFLLNDLRRTPYGINTCGSEPFRTVARDLFADELAERPASEIARLAQRIRWYWFPGDDAGFGFEPGYFESVNTENKTNRLLREVADSDVLVVIGGRTGTRNQVKRLLDYNDDPNNPLDLNAKPLLLLGWFGGTAGRILRDQGERVAPLVEPYLDLAPMDEPADLKSAQALRDLARRLVEKIEDLVPITPPPGPAKRCL